MQTLTGITKINFDLPNPPYRHQPSSDQKVPGADYTPAAPLRLLTSYDSHAFFFSFFSFYSIGNRNPSIIPYNICPQTAPPQCQCQRQTRLIHGPLTSIFITPSDCGDLYIQYWGPTVSFSITNDATAGSTHKTPTGTGGTIHRGRAVPPVLVFPN